MSDRGPSKELRLSNPNPSLHIFVPWQQTFRRPARIRFDAVVENKRARTNNRQGSAKDYFLGCVDSGDAGAHN